MQWSHEASITGKVGGKKKDKQITVTNTSRHTLATCE